MEINKKQKKYFTTPIYYVNSKPHIGHAFTMVVTDYLARFYRSIGYDVFYLTGTDEHGKKIEESAIKQNIKPKEFVDKIVKEFKENWSKLNLSFDSFIRTTDKKHEQYVKDVFQRLYDQGDLYKGVYKGKYCVSCEAYFGDDELIDGKLCPTHKKPVIEMEEETYFFKLSKYEKDIRLFLEESNIFPKRFRNELLARTKKGLKDISVSRKSLKWGIELPFDKEHVVYVWFDALLNYLSGLEDKDYWSYATHIIGKDILWFHTIYWIGLLKALDKELPKVFVHGWWTVEGEKMSKTTGNIITIDKLIENGVDVARFYLLRQMPYGEDSDYSKKMYDERYNELVNNVSNLIYRVSTIITKNNVSLKYEIDTKLKQEIKETLKEVKENIGIFKVQKAIETTMAFSQYLNKYVNLKEPWKLVKEDKKEAEKVLFNLMYGIEFLVLLLEPVIPELMQKLKTKYGFTNTLYDFLNAKERTYKINEPVMLLKRV